MALVIRACELRDICGVHALLAETWHATYDAWLGADKVRDITRAWHGEKQLTAQLASPRSAFLVAEDGAALVATSFAHETESHVELGRLYVAPTRQGTGIGSALLRETLAAFPAADRFRLEVEPRNLRAIAFYERSGFRRIPAAPGAAVRASGLDGIVMEHAARPP